MMNMAGGQDDMSPYNMVGGQSLDDIVNQNTKAMRRRSVPIHYGANPTSMKEQEIRRMSMMDFTGAMSGGSLDNFQFDPSGNSSMGSIMRSGEQYSRPPGDNIRQRPSAGDLALNTQFPNQASPFTSMPAPGSTYASPLHLNAPLDMDMTSPYNANGLPMPLDMNDPSLSAMMGNDMNLFTQPPFSSPITNSPVNQDFAASIQGTPQEPTNPTLQPPEQFGAGSESTTPGIRSTMPSRTNSQEQSVRSSSRPQSNPLLSQSSSNQISTTSTFGPEPPPQTQTTIEAVNRQKFPWVTPPGKWINTNI